MAEYIERGELEKILIDFYDGLAGHRPDFYAGFSAALKVIDEETTNADVVPVRHGRWEKSEHFYGYCSCSECHNCYINPEWIEERKWMYCPDCGAKMDGDNSEE